MLKHFFPSAIHGRKAIAMVFLINEEYLRGEPHPELQRGKLRARAYWEIKCSDDIKCPSSRIPHPKFIDVVFELHLYGRCYRYEITSASELEIHPGNFLPELLVIAAEFLNFSIEEVRMDLWEKL